MRRLLLAAAAAAPLFAEESAWLDETIIVASGEEQPAELAAGSTAVVSAADLEKYGSNSLVEAFQREPGVSIPFDFSGTDPLVPYLEGGSNSINIRGLEGNRVALLVDGIRQPEDFTSRSFEGTGGPGRIYFDPAVFARIELFKSAASTRYGSDVLGGAVLGRTESPETLLGPGLDGLAATFTTHYATANRSWHERFAAAWGNGDVASSIVLSLRQGHETENNGAQPANPAGFESEALVWTTTARLADWTIQPTLDYFHLDGSTDLRSIVGDSMIGETLDATNNSERERLRASIDIDYRPETPLIAFDELDTKIYWQHATAENLNRQQVLIDPGTPAESLRRRTNDLSYDTTITGLDLRASKTFLTGPLTHELAYGYDGSRSEIESTLLRTDEPSPTDDLPNMAPSTVDRHGLFISDRISFGGSEQWIITPGLRFEDYQVSPENTPAFLDQTRLPVFDEFGRLVGDRTVEAVDYDNFAIAPSLTILRRLGDRASTWLTWSNGFRNPSAEELAGVFVHPDDVSITLPNPDLEEEESQSFELGYRYRNPTAFSLEAAAYYNRYSNFLQGNTPTGEILDGLEVNRTENARDAQIWGAELSGEWFIGEQFQQLAGLSAGVSIAWSRGTRAAPAGGRQPLDTVEPLKAVGFLAYNHPGGRWGVELSGTWVDGKSADDIGGNLDPTDDYFLVDLVGYLHLGEHATLRAGARNLLDESYVMWSRANRGSGHAGGLTTGRDTQPGINGFVSLGFQF